MDAHKKIAVGEKAPDFTLASADGGAVSLSQYKGKAVVLAFLRSSG
jgi:peroxiredoxin